MTKEEKKQLKSLTNTVTLLNNKISVMKEENTLRRKEIVNMQRKFNVYINRQFSEIRVIEKDGKWGDYSGIFYLNPKEEKDIIIDKAKEHFETYFQDSIWHRKKHLGLFITDKKRNKRLIKEMITD